MKATKKTKRIATGTYPSTEDPSEDEGQDYKGAQHHYGQGYWRAKLLCLAQNHALELIRQHWGEDQKPNQG